MSLEVTPSFKFRWPDNDSLFSLPHIPPQTLWWLNGWQKLPLICVAGKECLCAPFHGRLYLWGWWAQQPNRGCVRSFRKKNAGSWTKRWTTTTEATKHIATVHSSVFLHLMWCMISFINSTFISRVSIFNFKYTGFLGLSRGPNFWQPQILDTATSGSCGSQHLFFWGSSPSGLCHLIVGARCRVVFFLWVDGVRWQGWH